MKWTLAPETSLILTRLDLECFYNFNELSRAGTINVNEIFRTRMTLTLARASRLVVSLTGFSFIFEGAGKTFTMLGTDVEPGIMALTLNDLYEQMEKNKIDEKYTVRMSYLEV